MGMFHYFSFCRFTQDFLFFGGNYNPRLLSKFSKLAGTGTVRLFSKIEKI
jgi:hypothetical protein